MHIILFEIVSAVLFSVIILMIFYMMFLKMVVKSGTKHPVEALIVSVDDSPSKSKRQSGDGGGSQKQKRLVYSYESSGITKTNCSRVYYADAESLVGKTSDVYIRRRGGRESVYLRPDVKHITKRLVYYYLRLIMVWLCCFIVFLLAILQLHSF